VREGVGLCGESPPPQYIANRVLPVGDCVDPERCDVITELEPGAIVTIGESDRVS
jgi:hypothetical protein